MTTTLHIRGMVCYRCEVVVRELMQRLGHKVTDVRLGQVTVQGELSTSALNKIQDALSPLRLELIAEADAILAEQIRHTVQRMIVEGTDGLTNSLFLSRHLGKSYASLSKVFVQEEGESIQAYTNRKRVDRVKELLSYGELTLTEIAQQLGYSSVQYLSQRFKSQVGSNPSTFKANLPKLNSKD